MKLLDLEIQNIGPFKGLQKIFFTSDARFVHIILGVNGTGKTMLLNAICWAIGLYHPQEDRFIKHWVHRGCKAGFIRLRIEANGNLYEITRNTSRMEGADNHSKSESQIFLIESHRLKSLITPKQLQNDVFAGMDRAFLRSLIIYDERAIDQWDISLSSRDSSAGLESRLLI